MDEEMYRSHTPKTEHQCLVTILAVAILAPAAVANTLAIPANFNGTSMTAGNHIWFTSLVKPSGLRNRPVDRFAQDQTRQFTTSSNTQTRPVADALLAFSPLTPKMTANFKTGADRGKISAPNSRLSGNIFISGDVMPVTSNLAGGISPEIWSAAFNSDNSGVSVSWQSAAVYSNFSTDLNTLGVRQGVDPSLTLHSNTDHAGTPGAREGTESNSTGSHSATGSGMATKPTGPLPELAGLATAVLMVAGLICLAAPSSRLRSRGWRRDDRLASALRRAIERGVITGDQSVVMRRQLRSVS